MRIMGIDFGDSRIGVAVSDPLGWTAQGLDTIEWKGPPEQAADEIRRLAEQYGVEKIVIGLPRNMNGTIGPSGEKAIEFGELCQGHRAGSRKMGRAAHDCGGQPPDARSRDEDLKKKISGQDRCGFHIAGIS